MRANREGLKSHPWLKLQNAFAILVGGRAFGPNISQIREDAYREILKEAHSTGVRFLSRWNVRNPSIEADDVVQQFVIELHLRVLDRCRDDTCLHKLAYKAFKRKCLKHLQKSARNRFEVVVEEPIGEAHDGLEQLIKAEELQALRTAMRFLTTELRIVIQTWLDHQAKKCRLEFIGRTERRRFAYLLSRARGDLKSLLKAAKRSDLSDMDPQDLPSDSFVSDRALFGRGDRDHRSSVDSLRG